MKKNCFLILLILVFVCGVFPLQAEAEKVWVRDILESPDQFWNRTVTVVGVVQNVIADPPGTTNGDYFLTDESTTQQIAIRTRELPPIGKTFEVTGLVFQDQDTGMTLIREEKRAVPGFPSWLKFAIAGGALLVLILLVIFIVLLVRPKKVEVPPEHVSLASPAPQPPPPPAPKAEDPLRTIKHRPEAEPKPAEKTVAFLDLGAELNVEKGPDKGKEHTIHKLVTTIGRAGVRKNDFELSDETVSKEQAKIYYDNTTKEFFLANESDTNPTLVNKKIAADRELLKNDDLIEAGATTIRFIKK